MGLHCFLFLSPFEDHSIAVDSSFYLCSSHSYTLGELGPGFNSRSLRRPWFREGSACFLCCLLMLHDLAPVYLCSLLSTSLCLCVCLCLSLSLSHTHTHTHSFSFKELTGILLSRPFLLFVCLCKYYFSCQKCPFLFPFLCPISTCYDSSHISDSL